MSERKNAAAWHLRYLYVGTSNVQKDVDYTKILGAKRSGTYPVSELELLPFRFVTKRSPIIGKHRR